MVKFKQIISTALFFLKSKYVFGKKLKKKNVEQCTLLYFNLPGLQKTRQYVSMSRTERTTSNQWSSASLLDKRCGLLNRSKNKW